MEYRVRWQLAGELESLGDDIDVLAQARGVDVADAGLPHGRGDDEVERPFEAYNLDRRVRQRLCLLERRNRRIRIGGGGLPGLDRRLDESAHRVRVLLGEGRGGEQHIGV